MAEEFGVIVKAKTLAKHTLLITSNANHYPKKFRFSLVDKMQNKSLEIYEALMEANRTNLKTHKRERLELLTRAITYCDQLAYYIELSYDLNIINKERTEYWTGMVCDVKYMTIAMRTKDRER